MDKTKSLMVDDMRELGVDIVDVRILRTDLTTQVSQQTYDRMKAERLAEAALLRARGQEAAQTARAIADRQAVEFIAAARGDSEKIRGEGDGLRSQIFADAYNKDPAFFDFYRSLQSYRTSLGSSGTTMVLSPDSEFFKFFSNEGNSDDAKGATPAVVQAPTEPPDDSTNVDLQDLEAPAAGDLAPPEDAVPANESAPAPVTAPANDNTPAPAASAPGAAAGQ
jgi:membrane protease subunit HflC